MFLNDLTAIEKEYGTAPNSSDAPQTDDEQWQEFRRNLAENQDAIEQALFATRRPVLLVPPKAAHPEKGAVVAYNKHVETCRKAGDNRDVCQYFLHKARIENI